MKYAIYIILIFATLTWAQPGIQVQTYSGYTNNAFYNHNENPDYYMMLNAYATWDHLGNQGGIRLFYDGTLTSYDQYSDKNYHTHEVGIAAYRLLGQNGNRFNTGVSMNRRMHSSAYEWFELLSVDHYANMKLVITDKWYGYAGWQVEYNNYDILDSFSNLQTRLFVRSSHFLRSGTSIIAETSLNGKFYKSAATVQTTEGFPELITQGDGNSYQLFTMLKAAQSLAPKTGLSGWMSYRYNLTNSTRYLGTETGYYYSDEEIFNDQFGYHAMDYYVKLVQYLPWSSRLTLGGSISDRDYQNRLALDLEGNPYPDFRTRHDVRNTIWFSLQKQLRAPTPLTLSLSMTLMKNNSNDDYYNYTARHISLNLTHSF